MKVLDPTATTHSFKFIPREYLTVTTLLLKKDEENEYTSVDINSTSTTDGISTISFDLTVESEDRYKVELKNEDKTLFKDVLLFTSQELETFKKNNEVYIYE